MGREKKQEKEVKAMKKWSVEIILEDKQVLDYVNGLHFYPLPFPHISVIWNKKFYDLGLTWLEKQAIQDRFYGQGELPEVSGIIYSVNITKEELERFLFQDRLVIEVYETAEDIDGDIVVAVNGVPVARSNKRLLIEKARR